MYNIVIVVRTRSRQDRSRDSERASSTPDHGTSKIQPAASVIADFCHPLHETVLPVFCQYIMDDNTDISGRSREAYGVISESGKIIFTAHRDLDRQHLSFWHRDRPRCAKTSALPSVSRIVASSSLSFDPKFAGSANTKKARERGNSVDTHAVSSCRDKDTWWIFR